jgi:hypothetical protein
LHFEPPAIADNPEENGTAADRRSAKG